MFCMQKLWNINLILMVLLVVWLLCTKWVRIPSSRNFQNLSFSFFSSSTSTLGIYVGRVTDRTPERHTVIMMNCTKIVFTSSRNFWGERQSQTWTSVWSWAWSCWLSVGYLFISICSGNLFSSVLASRSLLWRFWKTFTVYSFLKGILLDFTNFGIFCDIGGVYLGGVGVN